MTLEELKDYLISEIETLEEQNESSRKHEDWITLVKGETVQWHCKFILELLEKGME